MKYLTHAFAQEPTDMDTLPTSNPDSEVNTSALRELLLRTSLGYKIYMWLRWGSAGRKAPASGRMNRTLQSTEEVDECVREAKQLRLPPCGDAPKTWDTLAAVREILDSTDRNANILDAGAELYSRFLPWMYLYGYRNLHGINIVFDKTMQYGPIIYQKGDITRTRFPDNHFHAIACLSVVEHGVPLGPYFAEMSRILKPGGVLVTSTDYFETPTDTSGLKAYGVPIHVFDSGQMLSAIDLAKQHGLELTTDLELKCREKVVRWQPFEHEYTFIVVAMRKAGHGV